MAVWTDATPGNDYVDWSNHPLGAGQTSHSLNGLAGDDHITGGDRTLIGGAYNGSYLFGGDGNDILIGLAGNDTLLGDNGDDLMDGGADADLLYGGAGADTLWGNTGNDRLAGGTGNDTYAIRIGVDGQDIINDDMSAAWNPGFGGGVDRLVLTNVNMADIVVSRQGSDLFVTQESDFDDGVLSQFQIIQNFYLGGANVIELIQSADGLFFDTSNFSGLVNGNWYLLA
ncbi:calcium-binding protein [Caulobacter soli]|uniref:calcium-binding protein n=1 Tax=Caulobacter soli TaxID=2708539 RepID=UPI0013EA3461|nr:calcium-binding protein [Caulobacter soli]